MLSEITGRNSILDIDKIKKLGAVPHYFGLGFIQVKLNDVHRLHFWHPSFEAESHEEEMHDHRYNFHSLIMYGSLEHVVYKWSPDKLGDCRMSYVSCQKDSNVEVPSYTVDGFVSIDSSYYMQSDSSYMFSHEQFHQIIANDCITFVTRDEVVKDFARVIRPIDNPVVCPFSKNMPENDLWEIIREMIRKS